MSEPLGEVNMFYATNNRDCAPSTDVQGHQWTDENRGPNATRRRNYRLVVVCGTELLQTVRDIVQGAIDRRPVKTSVFVVPTNDDPSQRGFRIAFEAEEREQGALNMAIRKLCMDRRVRYVRLEPH